MVIAERRAGPVNLAVRTEKGHVTIECAEFVLQSNGWLMLQVSPNGAVEVSRWAKPTTGDAVPSRGASIDHRLWYDALRK